jgi:hypothetical protein
VYKTPLPHLANNRSIADYAQLAGGVIVTAISTPIVQFCV